MLFPKKSDSPGKEGVVEMGTQHTIELSMTSEDVAVLTFDMPEKGANILCQSVLEELDAHLGELEKRQDLSGLVLISGKPGTFIAGADIREFAASLDFGAEQTIAMCQRGQHLFQRLSACPFVTIAAIDGICVGGGAEMSVWCDRRIMTQNAKTMFGFPEVKLGLFPGWGGTARVPRMIGLSNALEIITAGEILDANAAKKIGLADELVPPERLVEAAIEMIRSECETKQYEQDRAAWRAPIDMTETELGFLGAMASGYITQQTKGHYPAPLAALEVMLGGAMVDVDAALEMEAEGMSELFGSPINAALINVFFLTDLNKKDKGIEDKTIQPKKIGSVGVVGAGIMGGGIAAAAIRRNLPVTITDVNPEAIARGVKLVLEEVSYDKQTKGKNVDRTLKFAPLLNASTSDVELAANDLVIEAIIENIDAKKTFFARIEPQLGAHTILASNTSTIPITRLAEDLKHPDRFCGIHFFNPVRKMPLVEVIRGEKTSDETIATAVTYAKAIGKSPIVVNDGPGFLVNRLLFPYMNEAIELISEGVPIKEIESAAKKFGMPMGPITLFDVVGLDTAIYAGGTLREAFPDRVPTSPILPVLVRKGRLGQKSGAGFYRYQKNKTKGEVDPELAAVLEPHIREPQKLAREQITHRLFLPMLLEATRILEEKIVRCVRDVDLGLIFGIGFPPFRGGLLFWADTLGAANIVETLKPFEDLGARFAPTPQLLEMAKSGEKFYN